MIVKIRGVNTMACECKPEKKKVRCETEYKGLINRLNRIEGQVRGVRGMIENDAYCIDVLTQISAISSALRSFSAELLENHIKSCVVSDIKKGNDEVVDELVKTLGRFVK